MYNGIQLSQAYVFRMGLVVLRKENDWVPLPGGETPTVGKTGLKNKLQTIRSQTVALHMYVCNFKKVICSMFNLKKNDTVQKEYIAKSCKTMLL